MPAVTDTATLSESVSLFIPTLFINTSSGVNVSESYDTSVVSGSTPSFTPISFDSNDLQTANYITNTINHIGQANKAASPFIIAHANATKIPFIEYPNKPVTISGTIVGSSISDFDDKADTFESYFINKDANLDIGYKGRTRRYIATAQTVIVDRPGNLAWGTFQVSFLCTDPFGRDTAAVEAVADYARTGSSYSDGHSFVGTAPYQLCVATISLTSLTGGLGAFVQWGNGANGQAITVDRTWTSGDILVIDCVQKIVTVNGVETAFSGAFPEFAPGSGSMSYLDNLTTRSFDINVAYLPRYL